MDTKLFVTISDTDFDPAYIMGDVSTFSTRLSARGLVQDGTNISLLHVNNLGFYKLPGGGIEVGETSEQAFKREIMEEVGCGCEIISNLGETIEYRDGFKLKQTSHIFVSHIVGDVGPNHLEPDEIAEGFEVMWVTPHDAVKLLKSSTPTDYEGKFIIKRDLAIISHYLTTNK